jgi:hypothetical protein
LTNRYSSRSKGYDNDGRRLFNEVVLEADPASAACLLTAREGLRLSEGNFGDQEAKATGGFESRHEALILPLLRSAGASYLCVLDQLADSLDKASEGPNCDEPEASE